MVAFNESLECRKADVIKQRLNILPQLKTKGEMAASLRKILADL
jgi:hypothetical protein